MKGKKLIIFDFDGVIIDSWEHAYQGNLMDWPDLQPHEHRNFFNGNVFNEVAKMPPSIISKEEKRKWVEEVYRPTKQKLPMFSGIEAVIEKLAENNRLVINTSSTMASTTEYLADRGLSSFFDAIYAREISTDKIQKFNQIFKDYNVKAEDCIFITDTVGDVLEAQHCAIKSVVVTYGYQDRSYFESIKDEVVGFADNPSEILNFITE